MKYQTSQQGFTLIELMIIVSIIGILASIAIPAYRSHIIKSQWISGFTEISSGKIGASTGIGKMSTFDPSIVSAIGLIAHTVNCDITAANTVGVITILCAHKGHEGVDGKITTLSRAITEEWSCTSTVAQSIIGSANKCTGV